MPLNGTPLNGPPLNGLPLNGTIGGRLGRLEALRIECGNRRKAMNGKMAFVALAVTTALGILGATSASAGSDRDRDRGREACVVPCSLDGVNPVYHPRIFGNPAFAKEHYGFVQGADHTWHVMPNCKKPAFIGPCGSQ
jgi:hypothetical protein